MVERERGFVIVLARRSYIDCRLAIDTPILSHGEAAKGEEKGEEETRERS